MDQEGFPILLSLKRASFVEELKPRALRAAAQPFPLPLSPMDPKFTLGAGSGV